MRTLGRDLTMTTPGPSTDEALYAAYRDRCDEEALRLLVERHWATSLRLARAVVSDPGVAEDVTQQAFVRVMEAARSRATLSPLAGWLRTVVVHEARNELRGRARRARREEASARSEVSAVDQRPTVRDQVERLPEKLRLPIVLHFAQGLTHAEVASALDAPVGTVSSWIRAGLTRLRAELTADEARALAAVPLFLSHALADDGLTPPPPSVRTLASRPPRPSRPASPRSPVAIVAVLAAAALLALGLAPLVRPTNDAAEPNAATPTAPESAVASSSTDPTASLALAPDAAPAATGPSGLTGEDTPVDGASAGADARPAAVVDAPDAHLTVSGRVVGPDGRGVPGATVALSTQRRARDVVGAWTRDDEQVARLLAGTPLERQVETEVSRYFSRAIEDGLAFEADEEGRFELGGLPLEPFELAVLDAEGMERGRVDVPAGASALPEIVVRAR